ncbi:MAG: AMP-binding protein [Acidobacteria bacterium]|nr:AMP-binding protein [Acidobacteriota bacterium]
MTDYPIWQPDPDDYAATNVAALAARVRVDSYEALHTWSVDNRAEYWAEAINDLGIVFETPPSQVLDLTDGVEQPVWLPGARLNIVASCFTTDPKATAVVHRRNGVLHSVTYADLLSQVQAFAAGFAAAGLRPGDAVAIAMPMLLEAVVAYLGIIYAGGIAVSIADSFAPDEIATRLRISDTKAIVTQDATVRSGRTLPMFDKVVAAGAPMAIVVSTGADAALRGEDVFWDDFVGEGSVEPVIGTSKTHITILFSSGTTGDPKAIPWTHINPIKAAADAYYHHDIQPNDVLGWPTNMGWVMGPWLVFAALVNGASMVLFDDAPTGEDFGRFVQDTGVTMLGVVPSLVAAWVESGCMEDLDWSTIRRFSSTGESSNPDHMVYLMALAGNVPVIEYCGGTEIGGAYITSTMVQPSAPSMFTTPTLGLDVVILDDEGREAELGDLYLVPPSIGLSQELLIRDHHEVYYADLPKFGRPLRRHGDYFRYVRGVGYRAMGRTDDTMNLGGIKVSSAEIERVVDDAGVVGEVAAVAVSPPGGGPSDLVLFVTGATVSGAELLSVLQEAIRSHLNPLFKIYDVVEVEELPRTASQKVMRRSLRADYKASH